MMPSKLLVATHLPSGLNATLSMRHRLRTLTGATSGWPVWVVKISLKHVERLMYEPKSKNYPIATTWLKRAKQSYKLLGKTDEWQKYLKETKEKYKRRPALQNQLARL